MYLIFLLLLVGIIAGAFHIASRVVRAMEQRPQRIVDDLDLGKRVQLLEETIDRQASEIQQLTENQVFLESLVKGRSPLPNAEQQSN